MSVVEIRTADRAVVIKYAMEHRVSIVRAMKELGYGQPTQTLLRSLLRDLYTVSDQEKVEMGKSQRERAIRHRLRAEQMGVRHLRAV